MWADGGKVAGLAVTSPQVGQRMAKAGRPVSLPQATLATLASVIAALAILGVVTAPSASLSVVTAPSASAAPGNWPHCKVPAARSRTVSS